MVILFQYILVFGSFLCNPAPDSTVAIVAFAWIIAGRAKPTLDAVHVTDADQCRQPREYSMSSQTNVFSDISRQTNSDSTCSVREIYVKLKLRSH